MKVRPGVQPTFVGKKAMVRVSSDGSTDMRSYFETAANYDSYCCYCCIVAVVGSKVVVADNNCSTTMEGSKLPADIVVVVEPYTLWQGEILDFQG